MGLVLRIGLGAGIGAGGINKRYNWNLKLGKVTNRFGCQMVVFRHPDAVFCATVLYNEPYPTGLAVMLKNHLRPVEGAMIGLLENFSLQPSNQRFTVDAGLVLGGEYRFRNVGINLELAQLCQALPHVRHPDKTIYL